MKRKFQGVFVVVSVDIFDDFVGLNRMKEYIMKINEFNLIVDLIVTKIDLMIDEKISIESLKKNFAKKFNLTEKRIHFLTNYSPNSTTEKNFPMDKIFLNIFNNMVDNCERHLKLFGNHNSLY